MRRLILSLCVTALPLLTPIASQAEGQSILVLDASGSMWGQIDGRAKLEIAREALASVVGDMPADTSMGLMVYGHRQKGACDDIELIVPPGKGTGAAMIDAANALKFLGKTPLTQSVRLAADALKSTEEKATVILITDGIETCDADPCALGTELEASGVDFTAHVVGFGLTKDEGAQVACLATNTGGQYIEAKDAGTLQQALRTAVAEPAPTPEPTQEPAILEVNFAPTAFLAPGVPKPEDNTDVIWEIHAVAADGSMGERMSTEYNRPKTFIEPGTYKLLTILDESRVETDLVITADTLAAPEIVMNVARVIITPKAAVDQSVSNEAAVNFKTKEGINATGYGNSRFYLPAGEVVLTASLGRASVTETLTLAAGDLIERDIIIGSGLAVVDGYYIDSMRMENTQHSVEILEAKQALDGSRKSIDTSYGPAQNFDLSPGDYIARVTQDAATAEVPFTVKVGERVDVKVALNAGVLAVTAPGASSIEVYAAKPDLNGNRKSLAFDYAESISKTMPEGDYVIEAKRGEVLTEVPASVKKGERTETTVP